MLSLTKKRKRYRLEQQILLRASKRECERSLAEFVRQAWHLVEPGQPLIWNWHLDVMCGYLEAYFDRRIKRLILNVPPGSLKSMLVSVLGPSWAWTRWPERRFINLTNESGLATRDSLRMRNIISSDWYQKRWGKTVKISDGQREKMHFENTARGFRQGLGITGNITGKRGTDLLIDDPLDAKKAFSDVEIKRVNDTYDQAVSSRLNDPSKDGIILIMQRLKINDLTGHLLHKKQSWIVVRIQMEWDGTQGYNPVKDLGEKYAYLIDPRKKIGELMFPKRFTKEVVESLQEDLGEHGTAGQLQQLPSALEGGIIKKHWWKEWNNPAELPDCYHIFSSNDTAFSEKDRQSASYSARTTWGVFKNAQGKDSIILLSAWWGRVGYPELRRIIKDHHEDFDLDVTLIEKKASGISLLQDMRKIRLPVRGFDPGKIDKTARAYLISPMFESGLVYYTNTNRILKEVIDHVAAFPAGAPPSADITDTVTQALLYVRHKMWLRPSDEVHTEIKKIYSQEQTEDMSNESRAAYG